MPTDDSGNVLNANFTIEPDGPYLALTLDSAGGKNPEGPSRNLDYPKVLTLLLSRLRDRDATLSQALVDSNRTRHLSEEERTLTDGPIRLKDLPDMDALRLRLTRAQGDIGQASNARRSGNNRKRMRLRLQVPGLTEADADRLMAELAAPPISRSTPPHPASHAVVPRDDDAETNENTTPESSRHPRYLQDARLRQAIEKHAVALAIRHYESMGYHIEDVGTRRSYDLHATKGPTVLHVEVKGSTGSITSVELTTNEVRNAYEHLTDLVVVDQIRRIDDDDDLLKLEGGRFRIWKGWQPADEDLQATRFDYRLQAPHAAG
ncbi:DUF3883 domain-containing protein [Nonomuraea sp. NPDC050404]|uniref:protein NO VEIN domain-containing protein n=1 Tax=Nonomuraea sp. NPDC050404 TaxID=3155783 RepID=UPI0033FA5F93